MKFWDVGKRFRDLGLELGLGIWRVGIERHENWRENIATEVPPRFDLPLTNASK